MPHNDPYSRADEKIARKKSIPAQIALWTVILILLFAFYRAFGGHGL